MTGLINIINQYSSKLNILPIIVVMTIIISVLIHFLTNKKLPKFIPSLIMGIGSVILLIYSLARFTKPRGLDLTWIAVFLGTSALVGIFVCLIIDLIVSIKESTNEINNNKQPIRKASKKKGKNKARKKINKKINTNKKSNSNNSKFHTKKIKNSDILKASKVNKKQNLTKDKIVIESNDDK